MPTLDRKNLSDFGAGRNRSRRAAYARSASVALGCSGTSLARANFPLRIVTIPSCRSISDLSKPIASPTRRPEVARSPNSASWVAARIGGHNVRVACSRPLTSAAEYTYGTGR